MSNSAPSNAGLAARGSRPLCADRPICIRLPLSPGAMTSRARGHRWASLRGRPWAHPHGRPQTLSSPCSVAGCARPGSAPRLRRPRLHDRRHSFAMRTLLRWHHADVDVRANRSTRPTSRPTTTRRTQMLIIDTVRQIGANPRCGGGLICSCVGVVLNRHFGPHCRWPAPSALTTWVFEIEGDNNCSVGQVNDSLRRHRERNEFAASGVHDLLLTGLGTHGRLLRWDRRRGCDEVVVASARRITSLAPTHRPIGCNRFRRTDLGADGSTLQQVHGGHRPTWGDYEADGASVKGRRARKTLRS